MVAALGKIGFINEHYQQLASMMHMYYGQTLAWDWTYKPAQDARRWMVRSLQTLEKDQEFFDQDAMTAALDGKILPLTETDKVSIMSCSIKYNTEGSLEVIKGES